MAVSSWRALAVASSFVGTLAGGCESGAGPPESAEPSEPPDPVAAPPIDPAGAGAPSDPAWSFAGGSGGAVATGVYHQLRRPAALTCTVGPVVGEPTIQPPPWSAGSLVAVPCTPRAAAPRLIRAGSGCAPLDSFHDCPVPPR